MHDWISWIANLVPMAILVAIWAFFMSGKGSGSMMKRFDKQVELLEQQIVVLRQANELLKKLVEAK